MNNVSRLPRLTGSVMPTQSDLAAIKLSRGGEYQLNVNEVKRTRQLIYSINKDGIRRYRTLLEGGILMVWRIK